MRNVFAFLLLSPTLVPAASAASGYAVQQAGLLASDGTPGDAFGSVAVHGDQALIGAPGDLGGQGSVYVYERIGATWTEQARLNASDGGPSDGFGVHVAVGADTAVVGAFAADGAAPGSGAAYVFVLSGGTWVEQAKLVATDGASGDDFGRHVAISGDSVVVAAFQKLPSGGANRGAAYVFTRTGTAWTQQAKLLPSDGAANDEFASSVAIDGDVCVVGALGDDVGPAGDVGAAYVYTRAAGSWSEQAKLTAADGTSTDHFGSSVSLDGSTIVVGARTAGFEPSFEPGAAYVFVGAGSSWTQQAKLSVATPQPFEGVSSVAVEGDTVVFGGPYNAEINGQSAGAGYVFERTGSVWQQKQKLLPTTGSQARVGTWCALQGGTVLLGAPNLGIPEIGNTVGGAWVYVLDPDIDDYCFGDGSGTACPCGNSTAAGLGRGCRNATTYGAKLAVTGEPSVGADTLTLVGQQMPNGTALYFQGSIVVTGGAGAVYGDGLRCAGGSAIRFGTTTNVGGTSTFPNPASPTALSLAGQIVPGATRTYQIWYRDPATYCTPDTFNFTNGILITWRP